MSRKEGKAGGGGSAFKPAFETGYFQFANFSPIFQCVKCDKIRITQPWDTVCLPVAKRFLELENILGPIRLT